MAVRPGDRLKISARDWNDVLAILAERRSGRSGFGAGALLNPIDRQTEVLARNDGEDPVDRFGVLQLTGPIFEPADNEAEFMNRPSLVGNLPAGPSGPHPVLIPQQPIASGRIGRCVIGGMCTALVDVVDERQIYADTADGVGTLKSAWSGPMRILWKETGTGVKKALVQACQREPGLDAVVTGAAQIGSSWRWVYDFEERVYDTSGEPLTDAAGLRSGTFLNEMERYNSATTPERIAPGALASDYPDATLEALRLPDDLPVRLIEVWPAGWEPGDPPVYKLHVPNSPLVDCT